MSGLKQGEVNLGTTIMAVKFDKGVVLGADSRTTTGSYIANRVTDKLTQVHDRIFCCRSGSAADTQAIADIVQYHMQLYAVQHDEWPPVETAAALFQQMCYQYKNQLMAGIIVAGVDKKNGPAVYDIPLGGSLIKEDFAIGGSGSSYIYGYSVSLAMTRDGSSGGVVRLAVITEEGVERIFVPGDKLPEQYLG
ncbi:hypothetical protein BB560_002334 [Smittium megazygosporum]|uniref:Proteasome subunit beta n=1 Tax=Smittium megazygosporum TaxID=133381 RepID=A0A2T9ZF49_9FUNG|nr:hypothetical protein BB560_002334 [Smittium megazygosporum]